MKEYLDKIGAAGSVFAGACCIAPPVLLGFVSASGLGFLISESVLFPLQLWFLSLAAYSLNSSRRLHGKAAPLYIFGAGAAVLLVTRWFSVLGIIAGLAVIVSAVILNSSFKKRCACEATT